MADENAPWSSRLLSLYPSRKPPEPQLETAGERGVLRDRIIAAAFDSFVCLFFLEAPILYIIDTLSGGRFGDSALFWIVALAALLPLASTYAFAFEWQYSRTPGKVWRRLITVTDDGTPCTLFASAIRNLARYLDYLGVPPLVVGVVVAAVDTDGKRIGDRIAETVVVRSQ
ncbi:MAG: RDD family protein [Halobacteriales archaeon]|nr:RDD family protein [Halobacteriales archaeon]